MKNKYGHILLIGLGLVLVLGGAFCIVTHFRESPAPIKTERVGKRVTRTFASAAERDKAASMDKFMYGGLVLFVAGSMVCAKGAKMAGKRSQERRMAPFLGSLPGYLEPGPLAPAEGEPYLAGRVVSVDLRNGTMHPYFLSLPPELRATAPDQVGTVVWVDEQKEVTGTFSGNLPALRRHWQVTLIDLKARCVIQQFDIAGAAPPGQVAKENLHDEEARTGRSPAKDVTKYLARLPRR
jgi:hypothetical protein